MPYLVDTDVLIDVSRNNEAAIDFLDQLDDSWSMSIMYCEKCMAKQSDLLALAKLRQRTRYPGYKCIGDYHEGAYESLLISAWLED
jgi:predicted nucleic acid-binding protein